MEQQLTAVFPVLRASMSLLDHAHRGVLADAADGAGGRRAHIGTRHGHHAQAVLGGHARAGLRRARGGSDGSRGAIAYDPRWRRRLAAAAARLPARLPVPRARQPRQHPVHGAMTAPRCCWPGGGTSIFLN